MASRNRELSALDTERFRSLPSREVRVPIPLPRLAFIDGERRAPDRSFRVALLPEKFDDDVLTVEDIAREELTGVAVERTDFPTVQFHPTAVGPIDRPQARLRIEQPQSEAFKGLVAKLGREDIEVAGA